MNVVILTGRLGRDPELRYSQSGIAYASGSIAVDSYKNGQQDTMWVRFLAFEKLAEKIAQYVFKGNEILIRGRLDISSYTDRDGNARSTTQVLCDEVKFLTPKGDSETRNGRSTNRNVPMENEPSGEPTSSKKPDFNSLPEFSVSEEDVPF